ncbi:MAG: Nucleotidyltransferase substrate binding protein, HI0074 family [candidate division TM6 bacterium GW2011_GWE2_41_16]|nr:MAG: Nucleotidyltransferase substrate binding protein, HI0074 family [candidate division TM6 bacterium GW2011_GWE2_41_16]
MDSLTQRKELLLKALATLAKSIQLMDKARERTAFYSVIFDSKKDLEHTLHDSMLQSFKYTVYTFFDVIKNHLREHDGKLVVRSPKRIFGRMVRAGLLDEKEAARACEMLATCKLYLETYSEEVAGHIGDNVKEYYTLMIMMVERIKV